MSPQPIIVWLRNDLRVDDNEALWLAARHAEGRVVPVYCIDPRQWADGPLGFAKMGVRRAQFIRESLASLHASLVRLGAGLVVRIGHPEVVLAQLVAQVDARAVYFHDEPTTEEQAVADAVTAAMRGVGATVQSVWGATLYHIDDLPYRELEMLPEVFTNFRKDVERQARIRPPRDAPETLCALSEGVTAGEVPPLTAFNESFQLPEADPRAVMVFQGGEAAAVARLDAYIWEHDALASYKETRNGLLEVNDSTKLSPWLSAGCISPRRVWQQVQSYEQRRVQNESTYWLIFELIWRDYFRFLGAAVGARLFRLGGIRGRTEVWRHDRGMFARWCSGETGVPFIDANMRELNATGFMSNRGRQNVASFLAKTLQIDWRWGAAYFESMLLDVDPTSNWGNWQYVSGVGSDPRDRVFNVISQAKRYDAEGAYVRRWCPELAELPSEHLHEPYLLQDRALQRHGIEPGVTWPRPVVDMKTAYPKRSSSPRGRGRGRSGRARGRSR